MSTEHRQAACCTPVPAHFNSDLNALDAYLCVCCHAGEIARKYIQDPTLLKFIDLECFIWSTVSADLTPMINSGMVSSVTCVTCVRLTRQEV